VGVDDRIKKDKQSRFAEKVQRLNEARVQDQVFPIFQQFGSVEEQGGDDQTPQLVDAYKALVEIVKEDATAGAVSEPNAIKERQFATDYLSEDPKSAVAVRMNTRILAGSRQFVESNFFRQLEKIVTSNPREARIGGVPSTINKVRGYVNIRAAKRDLVPDGIELQKVEQDYCWVMVFYLLRSGQAKEAEEYVRTYANEFRALDRNFATYITNYNHAEDRRIESPVLDRLQAEYNQRSKIAPDKSVDPYRLACYKIIGRCDLGKRSLDLMNQGIDDWIWLQFNLARESQRPDEPAGESFGMADLRTVIKEIGQRFFEKESTDSAGGYGVYFLLLILGGMFEQAVAYLCSYSYVSAVHFAIALDFYGLLRVSDFNASEHELGELISPSAP
jgi:nuclear pore complex protein Nup93